MLKNKHYFLKCNKLAWLCEAVEESTNIPEVSWDRQNLMTRNLYMKIIEDIINEMKPRQAGMCVCVKIKQRSHCAATLHKRNMYTGGTKPHEQVHTLGHV